jgi:hypothetical protein
MRILKIVFFSICVFAAYVILPARYKYAISDWYSSIGAPAFIDPPDNFSARDQHEVIRTLQTRGFKLTCLGNLLPEEKMNKHNDYLCYTFINSAYDNIPAKIVTVFFTKNKLSDVRLEFPESSFGQLHGYLGRKLVSYPRLDQMPNHNIRQDNFGKPVYVWAVKQGIVGTSGESTPKQIVVLWWSSLEP